MRSIANSKLIFLFICSFLLLAVLLSTNNTSAQQQDDTTAMPPVMLSQINPDQPAGTSLKPGLLVTYYLKFFKRDLSYINKMAKGEFESFEGNPITHLDHQFGKDEVFDSGTARGVALRMRGYLYFPGTGVYSMQALSNDGIFIYVSNTLAISDPKQHADRLSNIAHITIKEAGWYSVNIDYFQRKGTAALKLFWKTPDSSEFIAIPASSYGH